MAHQERRTHAPRRPVLSFRRRLLIVVVAGVFAVVLSADALLQRAYAARIMPGVRIGAQSVGSTPRDETRQLVAKEMDALENEGITLSLNSKDILLEFTVADTSGLGLTADVLDYDAEASAAAAFAVGHSGSPVRQAVDRWRTVFGGVTVKPSYSLDRNSLTQAIRSVLKQYEQPVVPVGFMLAADGTTVKVTPPKEGEVFDYAVIQAAVEDRIAGVSRQPVAVSLTRAVPQAAAADGEALLSQARKLVTGGPLTLRADADSKVIVKTPQFVEWLTVERQKDGKPSLALNDQAVTAYLTSILPQVNTLPKEAKFLLRNGKVTEFQQSSPGREADVAASLAVIGRELLGGAKEIALTMRPLEPQASADSISNLGVKELVGVGRTNFAGSPPNRRHNIQVGVDLLNGLLIRPGEEFSLIKAIGPVDATLGYRQELVIKENRTIPEFGGGLCQIGTTMFRLVLNAGLPILERKNHSYRVRYYEPPVGMDATIYEPKPDFRFRNDYGSYLLLQTRIEGDNLIFELWGTKDGRTATTTAPKVFNVVQPPEQLTIETTDLPPGTEKCTEKAHVGSDAEFTYSVTYADGRNEAQTFKSHYKPWRAVCFVGVKKLTPKKTDDSKTNANTNVNTNSNTNAAPNANANVNAGT